MPPTGRILINPKEMKPNPEVPARGRKTIMKPELNDTPVRWDAMTPPPVIFRVTPIGKPRMTQRDRWKKRPPVVRYHAFKDQLRACLVPLPDIRALLEGGCVETLSLLDRLFSDSGIMVEKERIGTMSFVNGSKAWPLKCDQRTPVQIVGGDAREKLRAIDQENNLESGLAQFARVLRKNEIYD